MSEDIKKVKLVDAKGTQVYPEIDPNETGGIPSGGNNGQVLTRVIEPGQKIGTEITTDECTALYINTELTDFSFIEDLPLESPAEGVEPFFYRVADIGNSNSIAIVDFAKSGMIPPEAGDVTGLYAILSEGDTSVMWYTILINSTDHDIIVPSDDIEVTVPAYSMRGVDANSGDTFELDKNSINTHSDLPRTIVQVGTVNNLLTSLLSMNNDFTETPGEVTTQWKDVTIAGNLIKVTFEYDPYYHSITANYTPEEVFNLSKNNVVYAVLKHVNNDFEYPYGTMRRLNLPSYLGTGTGTDFGFGLEAGFMEDLIYASIVYSPEESGEPTFTSWMKGPDFPE